MAPCRRRTALALAAFASFGILCCERVMLVWIRTLLARAAAGEDGRHRRAAHQPSGGGCTRRRSRRRACDVMGGRRPFAGNAMTEQPAMGRAGDGNATHRWLCGADCA
jgi:hypothetical protein